MDGEDRVRVESERNQRVSCALTVMSPELHHERIDDAVQGHAVPPLGTPQHTLQRDGGDEREADQAHGRGHHRRQSPRLPGRT